MSSTSSKAVLHLPCFCWDIGLVILVDGHLPAVSLVCMWPPQGYLTGNSSISESGDNCNFPSEALPSPGLCCCISFIVGTDKSDMKTVLICASRSIRMASLIILVGIKYRWFAWDVLGLYILM